MLVTRIANEHVLLDGLIATRRAWIAAMRVDGTDAAIDRAVFRTAQPVDIVADDCVIIDGTPCVLDPVTAEQRTEIERFGRTVPNDATWPRVGG